jgi:hypothetical protein
MNDQNHPRADEDILEIYAAGSDVEADRILLMLRDEGVEAHRRETSIPMYPAAGTARFLITVFASDADKARLVLKQAIVDEILPKDGTFL